MTTVICGGAGLAAAGGWLPPFGSETVRKLVPRIVSPGCGSAATSMTKSAFRLPNTTILVIGAPLSGRQRLHRVGALQTERFVGPIFRPEGGRTEHLRPCARVPRLVGPWWGVSELCSERDGFRQSQRRRCRPERTNDCPRSRPRNRSPKDRWPQKLPCTLSWGS